MKLNLYQKTAIITVIATLFLILVGGLVRAAGAGLGCPDWPKCFGTWIPPTSADALPAAFDESQFNVWKTWIEYINRLIGVVIGFLVLATFTLSFRYRKEKTRVFVASVTALVLVLFQAWLGGQVVRTGLNEWMITLHMLLAMIIVNVLLYATFHATSNFMQIRIRDDFRKKILWVSSILLFLTVTQMVLGTQVREGIDLIKEVQNVPPRSTWIEQVGNVFPVHRSFSWALVIAGGVLFYINRKFSSEGLIRRLSDWNAGLILLQVLIGAGLYYLDMPRILQVLHLVGISLMICGQFLLILLVTTNVKNADAVDSGAPTAS